MKTKQRGSGLLLVILIFAVLFGIVGISLERSRDLFVQVQKHALETSALNLAEAGVAYSLDKLAQTKGTFHGQEQVRLEPVGVFSISVSRLTVSNKIEIISTGQASSNGPQIIKTVRVVVQFSQESSQRPLVLLFSEELS